VLGLTWYFWQKVTHFKQKDFIILNQLTAQHQIYRLKSTILFHFLSEWKTSNMPNTNVVLKVQKKSLKCEFALDKDSPKGVMNARYNKKSKDQ